jgi:exosome complex component RRP46
MPKITYKANQVKDADASCVLTIGKTSVSCALLGPIEAKAHQANFTRMTPDVIVRPPIGMPTSRERHYEVLLGSLITKFVDGSRFPYTQLVVSIDILHDDGSCLSAIVNAFLVAAEILDLPMLSQPRAITRSATGEDDVLYPAHVDELCADEISTFVLDSVTHDVLYVESQMSSGTLDGVSSMLEQAIRDIPYCTPVEVSSS